MHLHDRRRAGAARQHRGHGLFARGRNERERICGPSRDPAVGCRAPPVPSGRARRGRDASSGPACAERHRRTRSARRRRGESRSASPASSAAICCGQAAAMRSSMSVSSSASPTAQPRGEHRENTSGFGARLGHRLDHRPHELQADRAVAPGDVVVLEERRRRQHDVGVARGVGEDLIEDDGEEIVALQPLEHPVLVGHRRQGIAVVDEQHLDRRRVVSAAPGRDGSC